MPPLKTAWKLPVATLLFALLTGCGSDNDSAAKLEKARQYLARGDTQAALIELKNAVQMDADNAEARFTLGRLQLKLGEFASAEKELRRAKAAGYDTGTTDALIAQALLGQGEYKRLLEEIQEPSPAKDNVPILVARAMAQTATAALDDARLTLARALEVSPEDPEALLAQAHLAWAQRDLPRAIVLIDQVLQLSPRHRDAWAFKAQTLLAQAKPDEAIAAYRTALDIDPGYHAARIALASLAIEHRQFDVARAEIAAVIKISPNNLQARYTRALIAFTEKKYAAAREDLTAVLRTRPDYPPANLLAGSTDFALGKQQSAESHLKKALLAAPHDPRALRMLAAVHLHQGRYVEARRSLDAIRADLHDASYHLIAGELALRQKQHDKAAKHFEEAARLKPGDATILTELGIARLGSGDPRGQTSLESAIALPGGGERAGAVLILDHLHNKRFDHALASIAEMERKQGASPLTSNYRGAALLGKKDRIRARESFTEALKRDPAFYPSAANLAQLDLLDKQPAAARKRFEDVLKADPRQLDAMLALARLARDNDTAMRWLQKAVQAHPTAVEPRLDMARLLFAAKQASQALTQAREALGLSPNNPVALELLGTIQFALGDHPNAIGTLRRLVEISPASSAARIKLARIQIAADQTADARRSLMDTLRTHPESLDAQALLVQLDLKEARYDEARKRAIAIQTAHPHAAIGFQLLGAVSLARQQPAEALTAFERAHTLTPKTDTLIQQHTALILLDRRNESEIRLAAWLKSRPGDNVARGALAESLLHSGHNKLAASQYRELNRKIPNNPTVLNNLAWASYAAGDPSALAFAEQALKARPDDASIMDTLGWILTNRNQTARGIAVLQQAQSRAPDSPEIQWHLASAFARAGNQTRARSELRRLLDSEVPFSQRDAARALLKTLETGTH